MRGRVVRALGEYGDKSLDELGPRVRVDDLGPRVRVDYAPEGKYGREWLRGLLDDLAGDGPVEVEERDGDAVAKLRA